MKTRVIFGLFSIILYSISSAFAFEQTEERATSEQKPSPNGRFVLTTEQIKKWGQYRWPATAKVVPATLDFAGLMGKMSQHDDSRQKQQAQIQAIIEKTFRQSSWWNWHNDEATIYNPVKIKISLNPDTDLAFTVEEPGFLAKWFDFVPEVINSSDEFELHISAYQMQSGSIKSFHQQFQASLSDDLWHELQQGPSAACSTLTSKAYCLVSIVTQQAIRQLLLKFMPDYIPVKARQIKPHLWQLIKPYGAKNGLKTVHLCYASQQMVMGVEHRYCTEIGISHLSSTDGKTYLFSPENWHPDSFTVKDFALWPLDRRVLQQ